jgi:glycosyltransferase involved in cell wall biosynthesis
MPNSDSRPLRVLHVMPMYGAELSNGSEYYSRMLATRLVRRGVSVDVFTTCTARLTSPFPLAMRWAPDYPVGREEDEGVSVTRFHTRPSLPRLIARMLSTVILARWKMEDRRYGVMLKGSSNLIASYERRARSRPAIFDLLFRLSLGPWSRQLMSRVQQVLPKYDLVQAGFVPFSLPVQIAAQARRQRTPVVLLALFHPEDLCHHHRMFYDCFANADAILAQTAYSADLFRRLAPGSEPVEVGAGVDRESFLDAQVSGARFRARHGLGGQRLVLCVGRKEYGKRYDLAVKAVDGLADDQTQLVLIGEDIDRKPVHSPRVCYLGRLSRAELIDAYDAADVLVSPSEHESFGMVFLEAWMRRKPVIGNAGCGPVSALITEGEDGFLCRNAEEFARRIRLVLDDPALALRLGENGHRKAMMRYTWEAIAGKVADLYGTIVDRRRASTRTDGAGTDTKRR